jgi:hypothetical protein
VSAGSGVRSTVSRTTSPTFVLTRVHGPATRCTMSVGCAGSKRRVVDGSPTGWLSLTTLQSVGRPLTSRVTATSSGPTRGSHALSGER